jgi:hypothetical protein
MYPLIEAMQMINDGEDPRQGRVDARLQDLMVEQIEAVGGKRGTPEWLKKGVKSDGKRRVVVMERDDPVPAGQRDPCAVYLTQYDVGKGDAGAKCTLCKMPVRGNTRNVKLGCGHLFHSNCITQRLKTHDTCPDCNARVS